jgi:hypothetical protein
MLSPKSSQKGPAYPKERKPLFACGLRKEKMAKGALSLSSLALKLT